MLILLSVSVVVRMSFCKAFCIFYLVFYIPTLYSFSGAERFPFFSVIEISLFLHKFSSYPVSVSTLTYMYQKMDLFLYQRLNHLLS